MQLVTVRSRATWLAFAGSPFWAAKIGWEKPQWGGPESRCRPKGGDTAFPLTPLRLPKGRLRSFRSARSPLPQGFLTQSQRDTSPRQRTAHAPLGSPVPRTEGRWLEFHQSHAGTVKTTSRPWMNNVAPRLISGSGAKWHAQ